jgi:tetratricopeptide (TPR) repeat protein
MKRTAVNPTPTLAEVEAAAARPETRSMAIDLAIRALGNGIEDALVFQLVAEGLEEDGRLEDAAGLASRATVAAPSSAEAWTEFSRLLLRLGMRAEAIEASESALKLDANSYQVQFNAAAAYISLNQFAAAALHAEQAATIRPEAAEPLSTLAIISARLSDFERARHYAESAVRLRPELPGAEIVLARVDLADDRPEAAIRRLRRLLGRLDVSEGHRAEALTALGDALDAANEPARAFASYAASNAVMAQRTRTTDSPDARSPVDHARLLERYFRTADAGQWRSGAGDDVAARDAAGHVFLLGFPRSGTTLLENALARHPGVLALEEPDALQLCANDLMADEAALDRLAQLAPVEADKCREIYWGRVHELLRQPTTGKVVIDKMPISTIALPLIAKLFPSARILFARRDPRDVTLSCYRRLFGINPVMAEFLTLDSAARYYDQVMRLATLYEDLLELPVHIVRHEAVVADFDGEIGKALEFIELNWRPEVRDFAERAISARTPSATQLAGGLDAKGVGAWRRFERQMAPVLPILAPWAERFGYPPADPRLTPPPADPRFEPLREEITGAMRAGEWQSAFERTDAALARGFRDSLLFRLRGIHRQQEGRVEEAVVDFETALADAPGDIGLLSALGLCLARSGRMAEALTRLDEAISLQPAFPPAHFNRGWTLESLGDLAGAREAYGRALALDPDHAQALGALAILAARAGDWDEAAERAGQALARDPQQPVALMAMADAELARGEAEQAEARVRAFIASPRPTAHERAVASQRLGDILDRRERYGEAFAAYEAGADGIRRIFLPRFQALGAETASALASRLIAAFSKTKTEAWRTSATPSRKGARHIFLVGFPRSGTTLAGQILAGSPEVTTLEERDPLAEATQHFLGRSGDLALLASLSEEQAAPWRESYWRRVRAAAGDIGGKMVVDKLPMNILGLPLIAKLFPRAKILLMRRDPRDVVLSCFRRQFAINPTTIDLLSLEGAARLFDLTMSLAEIYQAKLDLPVRIQSHEALVNDFDVQTREMCAFAGIPWRSDLADFARGAGAVATPSSGQIAAGLTAEGVGHWRCYREPLASVLPILAPWIERFGYPAD